MVTKFWVEGTNSRAGAHHNGQSKPENAASLTRQYRWTHIEAIGACRYLSLTIINVKFLLYYAFNFIIKILLSTDPHVPVMIISLRVHE